MSVTRKPDAAGRSPRSAADLPGGPPVLVAARGWFIALAVLVVAPWVVVAAMYLWSPEADPDTVAHRPPEVGERPASPGAWGQLALTPITISPPLEYVANDWGRRPGAGAHWVFPNTSPESLDALLRAAGLAPEAVARLRATALPDPRIEGMVVRPDAELIGSLAPEVRARLYLQLASTPLNFAHSNSFRFLGDSVEDWLGRSPISPETRTLLEPMIYRGGKVLHFADADWIRSRVTDAEELRRVAKVLLRARTVLVRLTITDPTEVDRLTDYWGRGGRSTDLRPLLESVAGGSDTRRIDIIHLLPAFARNRLYRYPKVTTGDLEKSLLANCLWTSLNFFSAQPDDRYLDVNTALTALRNDYYVVQSGLQLGDIVAFLDEEGDLFHAGVYIADDLVFSKNGTSPVAPWALQRVDELKEYYRVRSANPRLIYHRRNDF